MKIRLVRQNEALEENGPLPKMQSGDFANRNRFGWYETKDGRVLIYLDSPDPIRFPSKEAAQDSGYLLGE